MLIVGSGIAGASMARLAKDSRKYEVSVVDKEGRTGGLIGCTVEDGVLFHRTGGHVFNTKIESVWQWFKKYFDLEKDFTKTNRNAKIFFHGQKIGYPIENYLYQLDEDIIRSIINDYLNNTKIANKKPSNFREFIIHNFGNTLANHYFLPYNEKIWSYPLENIALPWLEGKLPMPNSSESLFNSIVRQEESDMVHSQFYYPKKGGSQFIIDRLLNDIHVDLNVNVDSLKFSEDDRIIFNGNHYDCLIYTGSITSICDILGISYDSEAFPYHGTTTILCETEPQVESWTYLPEAFLQPHRIIYTGNFSLNNNAVKYPHTCTIEISGKVENHLLQDIVETLPGIKGVIASNYRDKSYVIQTENTRLEVQRIRDILREKNIYLLGRFAEWEYYNMDAVINSSMNLFDII